MHTLVFHMCVHECVFELTRSLRTYVHYTKETQGLGRIHCKLLENAIAIRSCQHIQYAMCISLGLLFYVCKYVCMCACMYIYICL